MKHFKSVHDTEDTRDAKDSRDTKDTRDASVSENWKKKYSRFLPYSFHVGRVLHLPAHESNDI